MLFRWTLNSISIKILWMDYEKYNKNRDFLDFINQQEYFSCVKYYTLQHNFNHTKCYSTILGEQPYH